MVVGNCAELEQLVQRLATAMNVKGRSEHLDTDAIGGRFHAEEQVNLALQAIRLHKAEHKCEMKGSVYGKLSPAS